MPKSLTKISLAHLLSPAGMSLVEILVGLSILSLSILLSMQLTANFSQTAQKSQATQEFARAMATINSFASNEQSCRLAIGGPVRYGDPAGIDAQTLNRSGTTNIRFYQPIDTTVPGGTRPVFLEPNTANSTYGSWTVTFITARPVSDLPTNPSPSPAPNGAAVFPIQINITMVRRAMSGESFTRISARAHLTVVTDIANKIVSCTGLNFGTQTGSGTGTGGGGGGGGGPGLRQSSFPICGPDFALFSDGTRLSCRRIKCSPPNPTPTGGWNAITGDINCGP